MPYCPKCGKEVKEDAVFCPYCGQSLKPEDKVVYRRPHDEKNEKGEKNEKNEKDSRGEKAEKGEKNEGLGAMWGAVMGGLIVLWLGVTFLLRQYNYIADNHWWSWFMGGLGIIVILRGLMMFVQTSNWRASSGLIIGGAIVTLIGVGSYLGLADWWAFLIILVGAWIVVNAFMSRGGHPRP
jgi:vacuolar-type H+-ATPase subunit I/STV1/DNA-directed RNA polymerase subunit RPC12/RpoP